ncbi:MAG: TIGR03643 family protein [Hyphomicrobiaceae bacterium TMED74]|nr:TIGR03643 family protein [Filomicrobium sp.]RPG38463.1 MAG: TIGR03643 family protein [Hyphomicrobiaceae bacterium TMED74]
MTEAGIGELVELAWRDEVSFDDIAAQTGFREGQVIAIMRRTLKPRSFRLWRRRVSGRSRKHPQRARHR